MILPLRLKFFVKWSQTEIGAFSVAVTCCHKIVPLLFASTGDAKTFCLRIKFTLHEKLWLVRYYSSFRLFYNLEFSSEESDEAPDL